MVFCLLGEDDKKTSMKCVENKSGNAKKPELVGKHPGKSYLFFLTTDEAI